MTVSKRKEYANALRGRLLRHAPGLREENGSGEFEAVASYENAEGHRVFAFCLEGLLVDPDGDARFIPFGEVSVTDYYDFEKLKAEKQDRRQRSVTLTLCDGEIIDLPLNESADRFSERLRIGSLIEQRVRLAHAARRDATKA